MLWYLGLFHVPYTICLENNIVKTKFGLKTSPQWCLMSPSRLPGLVTLAEAVPGRARRGLREEATLELLVELLLRECGPGAMQRPRARPGRCQATQRSPHQVEKPGPPGPQEAWVGGSALTSGTTRRGATVV